MTNFNYSVERTDEVVDSVFEKIEPRNINKILPTLTCSITGDDCPFGQYADCNVCSIDTRLDYCDYATAYACFHCKNKEQCIAKNKYYQYDGD